METQQDKTSGRHDLVIDLYEHYVAMFAESHLGLIDLVQDDEALVSMLAAFDKPECKEEFCQSALDLDENAFRRLQHFLTTKPARVDWSSKFVDRLTNILTSQR